MGMNFQTVRSIKEYMLSAMSKIFLDQFAGTLATCQDYIDMTGSDGAEIRQFNFTLYILGFNTTYMNMVDQAIAENVTFQGMNATDYKALIDHMNGWRPVIVETQKAQAESGDSGKSITSPEEKLTAQGKASSKSLPQPKKIGKFNVEIR